MVWLTPLERPKMTGNANEEHSVDVCTGGKGNVTDTHDARAYVAYIEVTTVQANVTVVLKQISTNMRHKNG
jgi:hypothetical protein